jgi:hypothetical protein
MLTQLVDTDVVKGAVRHMSVQAGWCEYATRQECSAALEANLNKNPASMFRFMWDYWFYGLFYIIFASPFFLIDMPIRALILANDETALPKWPDSDSRFGEEFFEATWNWYNLYTARLFMPYHFFIKVNLEHQNDLDLTDLNMRYMNSQEASEYFMTSWWLLIPIVLQAIVMSVATVPLYLVYFINWIVVSAEGRKDDMSFM